MDPEKCTVTIKSGARKGARCDRTKCKLHRKKEAPIPATASYSTHQEDEDEVDGLPRSQDNLEEFMRAPPEPQQEEQYQQLVPEQDMLTLRQSNPEAYADLRKVSQYRMSFPSKMKGVPEAYATDSPERISYILNLMRSMLSGDQISVRAMKTGYTLGMRGIEAINEMIPFSPARLSGLGDAAAHMAETDAGFRQVLMELSIEYDLGSASPSDPASRLALITLTTVAAIHLVNSKSGSSPDVGKLASKFSDV